MVKQNKKMENKLEDFYRLKQFIANLEKDIIKLYERGNETAGTRVSKGMQEIKIMAQDVRLGIFKEKVLIKEAKEEKKRNK